MIGLLQRVTEASVTVGGQVIGRIDRGLLVLVAVHRDDEERDIQRLGERILTYRVFPDAEDRMNLSVQDVGGKILLVSNFTLHGDCRKGRRPGFDAAAQPQFANQLYDKTAELISSEGITVEKGLFGEHMHVSSINDGPVTFLLDSSKLF